MLLPDNINPRYSVYYNGYLVLHALNNGKFTNIDRLYLELRNVMSFSMLIISLDWLFIIGATFIDENGGIRACLSSH